MTVDDLAILISNLQADGLGDSDVKIPSQTGGEMELSEVWEDPDYLVVHLE